MTEHDFEPVRGLPGHLPPGERIIWQGGPDRAALARTAFHTRAVAVYFALLVALAIGTGSWRGTVATGLCGLAALGVLNLLAWAAARSTVYTLTDRRIVLRVGVALQKCVNLPLKLVVSAELGAHGDGTGDIPLRLSGPQPLGWFALWPHARPWRMARPEPMLRAVPDAERVAALVARACLAVQPDGRMALPVEASAKPVRAEPVAA